MATQNYHHLNGAAMAATRVPLWQTFAAEMKLATIIGASIAAFVIPIGIALHTAGYINGVRTQDFAELSKKFDKKFDGLADKMDREFTALKKDNQKKEDSWTAQMASLQDDMAGSRSETRALAVSVEELKIKVSAPPPLPTRKPSRPKTASAAPSSSLLVFGKK